MSYGQVDNMYRPMAGDFFEGVSDEEESGTSDEENILTDALETNRRSPKTSVKSPHDKFNLHTRILGSIAGVLFLFVVTTALVDIDTDHHEMIFFTATCVMVAAINAFISLLQGAVVGVAGKFPPEYMGAVVSGQAVSGILASIARVLSLALGISIIHSAFVYFLFADIFLLVGMSLYLGIFRTIRSLALSVMFVFTATIGVFPAVTVLAVSSARTSGSSWSNEYFIPIACFLLFNCGDFSGRLVAGQLRWPSIHGNGEKWILFLCCARLVFIPLFMFCNLHPRAHLPVLFPSDWFYVCFMLLFAFSNGYLFCLSMMYAPMKVTVEEQETAGNQLMAFLGLGLCSGSIISACAVKML
ncbi:unnamed protein product [Darwinula stevensoni]|uniref:Uncharacterized protein n=1 Tax=Darwinula stevensoni TaxID=69355 RepID=A0A7R8X829_9CRUS|nr:unnamed protein product [Darwinula stevensoni]CAG0883967.1 unnamed protein product [Darwinula stevensoni]